VQLDHYAQCEMHNQLPSPTSRPDLLLWASTSSCTCSTSHAPKWKQTFMRLEEDIGISSIKPTFDSATRHKPGRTTRRACEAVSGGLFHGQLEKVTKVRIKRSRHGSDLSDVRPPLTRTSPLRLVLRVGGLRPYQKFSYSRPGFKVRSKL
jgi:hypothetical protein